MSSFALRATILITLDRNAGQWCSLIWLAGRVVAPQHEVRRLCEDIAEQGQALSTDINGVRCYGVGTSSASEVLL